MPFLEMLERTAQVAPKAGLRLALGDSASEIAKLMPELRQMYPDIPPALQLPPEQQRRYLFNAYRAFLERGAKSTPVVLVFEDLHWADEPTLLLLQHIAQMLSTTPTLVIGTYRDVELEVTRPFAKMLESMLRQKQATRISLRRLAVGGVESMLAALSGQTPPPSLARVMFAETEGNPFFVEEIFRHLAEEGKLFDETGKWRPGLRADQLQVPEGVRLVLGRRLDRLGADARRILTTAAVIGRSFSLRLLEELESKGSDAALDAVEEAERAHLVSAEPAAGREMRYRSVHELVRQTLAETLSLPRRQRLHARVADAIERLYAANPDAHVSALAHHLYQAGAAADPEKTVAYLAMAAALRSLVRWDEAIDTAGKALSMFENTGAVAKIPEAGYMLAMDHVWRMEFAAGARSTERALESLGSAEPGLRLKLLSLRAAFMSTIRDVAGAASLRADLGAPEDTAGAAFYLHSMQWEQAAATAWRVTEALRAKGDLWGAAACEFFFFFVIYCGRLAEAARDLPGAMQLAEKVGHVNALGWLKSFSVRLPASRGDLRQAEREAEEAWNFIEAHQVGFSFLTDALRGSLAFLRGNLSDAERWFCYREEPQTFFFGWKDACLFALWAEAKDDRAGKAWTERRWNLPKAGQLNPAGDWHALKRSVVGLASMGKREEAAALRPLTEELVRTGVWVSFTRLHSAPPPASPPPARATGPRPKSII